MADVANYVEVFSGLAFLPTLDRLITAIEHAGMTVFAQIDHAAGARQAGMSMPPTVVLLYGNPAGGTPIMLAVPQAALDLPLRVLLREDEGARTIVSYHPIAATLQLAGVPEALATRLEKVQHLLINSIASAD